MDGHPGLPPLTGSGGGQNPAYMPAHCHPAKSPPALITSAHVWNLALSDAVKTARPAPMCVVPQRPPGVRGHPPTGELSSARCRHISTRVGEERSRQADNLSLAS